MAVSQLDLSSCPVTDHALEHLTRLTKLRTLDLGQTRIQGTGLALLDQLGELDSLTLDGLPVGDGEVSFLAKLVKLQSLSLRGTNVGDQGADWLAGLSNLRWVTLSNTRVGDDALRHLGSCKDLITLSLDGTKVSGDGLAQLPETFWGTLSLTGIDLRQSDFGSIAHLRKLSTLMVDHRVVTETVISRLREMHMVRQPAYDEGIAAFERLDDCPLCGDVIEEDSPVFVPRPFFIGPEFWHLAKVPIHWDCFARWDQRPEFARRYFQANVEGAEHNQFWGVAHRDEHSFVSVNPSQYVQEVQVILAETGSDFRVNLADWQDWLEGEWFESCQHEIEREALARVIPFFREKFPTAEAVVEAAGFSPEEPPAGPDGMVGQISYEFACDELAKRAAEKGLACPHCGEFSNDYEYQKVEVVDPDGPRSMLVCKNCEEEFGPDDMHSL